MMQDDTTAKSEEKLSNIASNIDVEMADTTEEQSLQKVESILIGKILYVHSMDQI